MDVNQYKQKVIELFKSGRATDNQWNEMASAVSKVSEDQGGELTNEIDNTIDPPIYCHLCSEAGGADRAIYHTGPACPDSK